MKILTSLPYVAFVPMAVLMALAPFGATPHLVEKWHMAFAGTLHRPLDWLDLVMHTTPLLLLILKLILEIPRGER